MATLTIRKLDDDVYERLRAEARRNERSIEAEARHMLAQHVGKSIPPDRTRTNELVERLRAMLDQQPVDPDYPGSVAMIRAIRDEE
jgi:plasmid stability protein